MTGITSNAIVKDFAERAGWSAGQQFFAVLLTTGAATSAAGLPWKLALVSALGAAVASVVATGIQYLAKQQKLTFWPDLLARTAKTFLASLGGSFAAAHPFNVITFDWTTALNLAGVAALSAVAKGLLASSGAVDTSTPMVAGQPVLPRTPSTLPGSVYRLATGI